MPKTTNVLLSIAAIGGGAYWYDQNVQPLWSQRQPIAVQQQQQPLATQVSKESQDLAKKLSNEKKQVAAKTESTLDSIKNSNIVTTLTNSVGAQSPKTAEAVEQSKPLPTKLVHYYIDAINSFGESALAKISTSDDELRKQIEDDKKSWVSWLDLSKKKTEDEVNATKDSWFSWGETKKQEVQTEVSKAKDSWFSWGEDKKSELEATKNDLKDWNSKKVDEANRKLNQTSDKVSASLQAEKQHAIENYEAAKKNLDSLYQKINNKLFKSEKEQQDHLKKATDDFNSSLTNLKKYGNDVVGQIDKDYYQPLKSKADNLTK